MKKLILLLTLCTTLISFSQGMKRISINGKIIVEGSDIEGIAIYNLTSKEGTITDKKGEFILSVALDDIIEVRSLEYNDLNIAINEAILISKRMRIFLIEEVTKLDEIVIPSKKLTGNLNEDIKRVRTFNQKLDDIYFGIKDQDNYKVADANLQLTPEPIVKSPDRPIVDGLNIINVVDQLLIPLFRSEVNDKKAAKIPSVPVESIKYYLGSNFLVDNFKIPEHRVEEFIRYVEDDKAFDVDLLNYGNELELLELLTKKSKKFLKEEKK